MMRTFQLDLHYIAMTSLQMMKNNVNHDENLSTGSTLYCYDIFTNDGKQCKAWLEPSTGSTLYCYDVFTNDGKHCKP